MATDKAVRECRLGSLDVIGKTNSAKLHSVEIKTDLELNKLIGHRLPLRLYRTAAPM